MFPVNLRHLFIAAALSLPALVIGVQAAQAEDLQFTLHNNSSATLTEFYVEPMTSTKTWGENILSSPIAPGESATVTIADGKTTCTYGIRGDFKDAAPVDHLDLNLCELGSYTYNDK
jgi:hypothetical protein